VRSSPRVRQNLTRGGVPPLERGRISPEGVSGPRARRGLVSAALRPSSEAEFHSRTVGPTALVGHWGHQGRGPGRWDVIYLERVLGFEFICVCFFTKENGFPLVF
jgi:hypothetical protein